ncbi:MAG: BrnA antitoxin family protein [Sphingomonadales bacterium]|nr:BrnA antitoxin family protein [Sphingomonadales bacterium]
MAKHKPIDPDNPPMTAAQLKRLRPATEALPNIVAAHARGVRGPQKKPLKVPVAIRLSPEVLAHFKAKGRGWQTRIDQALKEVIDKRRV